MRLKHGKRRVKRTPEKVAVNNTQVSVKGWRRRVGEKIETGTRECVDEIERISEE